MRFAVVILMILALACSDPPRSDQEEELVATPSEGPTEIEKNAPRGIRLRWHDPNGTARSPKMIEWGDKGWDLERELGEESCVGVEDWEGEKACYLGLFNDAQRELGNPTIGQWYADFGDDHPDAYDVRLGFNGGHFVNYSIHIPHSRFDQVSSAILKKLGDKNESQPGEWVWDFRDVQAALSRDEFPEYGVFIVVYKPLSTAGVKETLDVPF